MIKPTVGRVVLYWPSISGVPDEQIAHGGIQPLAAIVTHVWSDACVNLVVFDANGFAVSRTSVPLIQPEEPKPEGGFFCNWMPYQVGQAAKTEELEKRLAAS